MPGEGIFWGGHAQAFTTLKYIILFLSFYVSSMQWQHLFINFEIICVGRYTVHRSHLRIEEKGSVIRHLLSKGALSQIARLQLDGTFARSLEGAGLSLPHLQAFPQGAHSPLLPN